MKVLPRGSHEELEIKDEADYEREIESKRCPTCHGNDYVRRETFAGTSIPVTCPDCSGRKR